MQSEEPKKREESGRGAARNAHPLEIVYLAIICCAVTILIVVVAAAA